MACEQFRIAFNHLEFAFYEAQTQGVQQQEGVTEELSL